MTIREPGVAASAAGDVPQAPAGTGALQPAE